MDPASIFKLITNSTFMVTRLLGESNFHFSKPKYELNLSELSKLGPILTLSVNSKENSNLHFSIKNGNQNGIFQINDSNGVFSLIRPLDFETQDRHVITIEATQGDDVIDTKIVIEVKDENEFHPRFSRHRYVTQVTEEDDRHLPKIIMTVTATDADEGKFGNVKYGLIANSEFGDISNLFTVNKHTGQILLLKPLDRDAPGGRSQWHFNITASDEKYTSSTVVYVNVKDVNDNSPFFPESIMNVDVNENEPAGTLVTVLVASDMDDPREGSNAQLDYSLQKNVIDESSGRAIFNVSPKSGRIETAICCLDREKTPSYTLQVVASDGGGRKGTGTVMVRVADENDVPPRFTREEWQFNVKEERRLNDVVATVSVVDPDIVNDFNYKIVPESGDGWELFHIVAPNKNGADILAKNRLDFEDKILRKGFRFKILVTDKGENGWDDEYHIDSAWINIALIDVNDHHPQFLKEEIHTEIPEDAPIGFAVASVKAIDLDGGGTMDLFYSILGGSDPEGIFQMDQSGNVRLKKMMDREKSPNHTMFILASDSGTPSRTATATVKIRVMDVNDNPPILRSSAVIRLENNGELSSKLIGNVTLDDLDDWESNNGPPFTLKIDPNAPELIKDAFELHFETDKKKRSGIGTIRSRIGVERFRDKSELILPLVATDSGIPSRTSTLSIKVVMNEWRSSVDFYAIKQIRAVIEENPTEKSSQKWIPLGRIIPKQKHSEKNSKANSLKYPSIESYEWTNKIKQRQKLLRQVNSTRKRKTGQRHLLNQHFFHDISDSKTSLASVHNNRKYVDNNVYGNSEKFVRRFDRKYSDWDEWEGFILNRVYGTLFMDPRIKRGKYDLDLLLMGLKAISNRTKRFFSAKISVEVKLLKSDEMILAIPLTFNTGCGQLLKKDRSNSLKLDTVIGAINDAAALEYERVSGNSVRIDVNRRNKMSINIISITHRDSHFTGNIEMKNSPKGLNEKIYESQRNQYSKNDNRCVTWIYGNSVINIGHVIRLQREKIENKHHVQFQQIGLENCDLLKCPGGCWSQAQIEKSKYSLVQSHGMAFIGPSLLMSTGCGCSPSAQGSPSNSTQLKSSHSKDSVIGKTRPLADRTLFQNSKLQLDRELEFGPNNGFELEDNEDCRTREKNCLNGGQCIPSMERFRCVCPQSTFGSRCKIIDRYFDGDSIEVAKGVAKKRR